MEEMEINLWLFFTSNFSITANWLIYAAGIFLSAFFIRKKPKIFSLTLIVFSIFLFESVGNVLLFLGITGFTAFIRQGQNQEIYTGITNVLGFAGWVVLFYVIFFQDTKSMVKSKQKSSIRP